MHLLVPFASALAEPVAHVLQDLALPGLRALASRLQAVAEPDPPDAFAFSPPHERALALALGWSGGDGQLPLAAWRAAADGIATGDLAWGELTPAHWVAGRDHVKLADPALLALDEADSRVLLDAVRALFVDEGFAVAWGAPLRWYVAHERLAGLRTASPDRAIGRNVDPWLPYDPSARLLRRLQQEVQMVFYQHPLHDARVAAGALPVNSVWLSGCGVAQPAAPGAAPETAWDLRAPALAGDWTAWAEAWQALDAARLQPLAEAARRGEPVSLTLCGERTWLRLQAAGDGWFRRVSRRWRTPDPATLLAPL